jgi:hypothetical protein
VQPFLHSQIGVGARVTLLTVSYVAGRLRHHAKTVHPSADPSFVSRASVENALRQLVVNFVRIVSAATDRWTESMNIVLTRSEQPGGTGSSSSSSIRRPSASTTLVGHERSPCFQ